MRAVSLKCDIPQFLRYDAEFRMPHLAYRPSLPMVSVEVKRPSREVGQHAPFQGVGVGGCRDKICFPESTTTGVTFPGGRNRVKTGA